MNTNLEKIKETMLFALDDCTGCTDPKSEGTHQMWSKQHFWEWYIEPIMKESERVGVNKFSVWYMKEAPILVSRKIANELFRRYFEPVEESKNEVES